MFNGSGNCSSCIHKKKNIPILTTLKCFDFVCDINLAGIDQSGTNHSVAKINSA